jgi:hypothetical protein
LDGDNGEIIDADNAPILNGYNLPKKINQLPACSEIELTDLLIKGDPVTGVLCKLNIEGLIALLPPPAESDLTNYYTKPQVDTLIDDIELLPGPQGEQGPAGIDGLDGQNGAPGADSTVPGPQGEQGVPGEQGPAGADSIVPGPQGEQGLQGLQGIQGVPGADSTVPGPIGPIGPTGLTGATGPGVPTGGTANQVLQKIDSTDFNTEWHTFVKADVGLSNVDNVADALKPVSTAQAAAIAIVQVDVDTHEADTSNPHSVTKSQVGLGNADNTSDINKPVSTAQAAADIAVQNAAASDATTKANAAQTAAIAASPAETTTTEGALINNAASKTTPVDADEVGLMDSAASNILKKLSWANIKATLKTYFDSIYQAALGFTAENIVNKDTDSTFAANSNTKYPSQAAVKTAIALKLNAANPAITGGILTSGSTPSIAAGTGAGTGPTISITGNDIAGYISLTAGTSPTATGVIATITFSTTLTNTPKAIMITAGANQAATQFQKVYVNQATLSTTSWELKNASVALGSNVFVWFYQVIQ